MKICPHCNGRGWVGDNEDHCPECNGTGQVEDDDEGPALVLALSPMLLSRS